MNEKAGNVNCCSQCSPRESTCCRLQYDSSLISVACSFPELSISVTFGRSGKGSFTEKANIVNRGSQCSPRESTCSKVQYDPYLISEACSYAELYISVRFGR